MAFGVLPVLAAATASELRQWLQGLMRPLENN